MKLIVVAHNLIRGDGTGRVNYEIVRYALERGHQVTVLATRVDPDIVTKGAVWRLITSRLPKLGIYNVRSFARQADRILKQMTGEADCLIGNGYTMTVPHDLTLCHFVHGAWLRSSVHPAKNRRGIRAAYQYAYSRCNARWEKKTFDAARQIVVSSRLTWNELLSIDVPEEKIRLIPHGVDLTEFSPAPIDRQELGLPSDVPLGLFAGDIKSSRKNLESVLKSMLQLPQLHLAVVGALAGSPYPAMAQKLGIASRVHFLGYRRDIGNILRGVDLFIFPSRYETFGLVILEAMAAGVPVITAGSVGASELVTPDSGTVLPDPDNVQDLARAIRRYLEDPIGRQNAARAARQVAETHSWTDMARAYLDLMTGTCQSMSR